MAFDFDTSASGLIRPLAIGSLSTKPVEADATSGRQRILRNLYRAINKNPNKVLVTRPSAPGNMRWTIPATSIMTPPTLTIQRPRLPNVTVTLENATIAQVRDNLVGAGVALDFITDDPVVLNLSALALIPGTGEKWQNNGDHIYAHRSILWSWSSSVGRWLDQSREDIAEMLRMLVVRQSGGQWSDLWASYFGLTRKPGEPDEKLNTRTEWEWRRPRSNPKAMERNIQHLLDQTVTVREPWKEMMIVSGSVISGGDHIPNEAEFAYHRIQLRSRDVYDFGPAMEEAEADRPAGTLLIAPVTYPWPWLIQAKPQGLDFGNEPTHSAWILDYDGHVISGNWELSDSFFLMNPILAMSEELQFDQTVIEGRGGDISNRLTLAKGEVILSEQGALGYADAPGPFDLPLSQERLGGRMLQEFGEGLVLSDGGALSDYEHELRVVPIDEWLLDRRSYDPPTPLVFQTAQPAPNVELSIGSSIVGATLTADAGTQTDISMGAQFAYDTGWNGRWTARPWSFGYRKPVADFKSSQSLPDGVKMVVSPTGSGALTTQKRFSSAQVVNSSAQASLTTAITLASTSLAQSGYLVTFGAAIRMAANLVTPTTITGALSTQINLNAAMAAPGGSLLTASLTTSVALQGQAVARSSILKSAFAVAEISGVVTNVAYSFGALSTAYPLSATVAAEPRASVVLTVGRRFSTVATGVSSGQGDLYTEARFVAEAAAQSSATAGVRVGTYMQGAAQAQSSIVGTPKLIGAAARLQAAVGGTASRLNASLRVGVRFQAAAKAVSARTAALTAIGAQTLPTANRHWLFDPDDASKTNVVDGRVVSITEANLGDRAWTQDNPASRPGLATFGIRRFMDMESAFGNLNGNGGVVSDFNDLSSPATYHVVFRTPPASNGLWGSIVPIMGGFVQDQLNPQGMFGLDTPGWGRSMVDWKGTSDSGYDLEWRSSSQDWATDTTYLLTWRRNSDATTDFFINGTKMARSGNAGAWGVTYAGLTNASIGSWWPVDRVTQGRGYIGANMRYYVAQSDAEIANMNAVKQSRYGN